MRGGGSPVSQLQVRGSSVGGVEGLAQSGVTARDVQGLELWCLRTGLVPPPAGPAWSPVSAVTWLCDAEEVTPFRSHLGKNQGQQLPCPASPSRGPGEGIDEEALCQPSRWHVKILMVSFI